MERNAGRMMAIMTAVVFALVALAALLSDSAYAKDAPPEAADPALESRMVRITSELRCLVCQNQTIADSNAALAVDLRRQVREALKRGDTDVQIVDYMTARYGDFVLYRPRLRTSTALLWFGPGTLLLLGFITLTVVIRRRMRLPDDRFEADVDEPGDGSESARGSPLDNARSRERPLAS